jgi:small-conductance mechanosensitive channel
MQQFFTDLQKVMEYPLLKLGGAQLTLAAITKLLALLALVVVAEIVLRRLFVARVLRHTRLQPAIQFAVGKILGYVFIAVGWFVSLQLLGIDLSSLAVLAGAVGLGLGFGFQNIVSNFVSGLIILAERPVALGDRIEVDGVNGVVTRISLRSTTVVTSDNITIIVPNSDFIAHTVTNWSHGDPKVRTRLPVGVAYGTDIERLKRLLLEVSSENPKVLREPPPEVLFVGFGDSALNFELAVWSVEMIERPLRFRSDLYFALEKKLREHQIEIPFPQRDLHLRSGNVVLQAAPPPSAGGKVAQTP